MKTTLSPKALIRLTIYILGALIGLGALVAGILGYTDLAALLTTIAGASAAITGGTAVYNIEKAPGEGDPAGIDVEKVLPSVMAVFLAVRSYMDSAPAVAAPADPAPAPEVPAVTPGVSLDMLRDMIASRHRG